ncbi:hypothetical protein BDF14DRAFT_1764061 [Spinellus fusiger]|nr:hypothetical protein BDF14DRAFT_1764061 [Spinellus fusiger]
MATIVTTPMLSSGDRTLEQLPHIPYLFRKRSSHSKTESEHAMASTMSPVIDRQWGGSLPMDRANPNEPTPSSQNTPSRRRPSLPLSGDRHA